jgi:hypothetical protein
MCSHLCGEHPSKKLILALLAIASYCASNTTTSALTITGYSTYPNTVGVQSSSGFQTATFSGTSIPSSHLLDLTRGEQYSRTQIDFTGSGNQVTLLNTFSQRQGGAISDTSWAMLDALFFSVDANASYSLSGGYSVSDNSLTASRVIFRSYIQDATSGLYVAGSDQVSYNTLNESFILGGSGGDFDNNNFGSLTGTLVAGRFYKFSFLAMNQAFPAANGGATSTGFVRLDIGGGAPSNAVPDGGTTLALLGLTLTSLAVLRRKFTGGRV